MVYAIIFSATPDLIKIGHALRGVKARYGSLRKMEEVWTWRGGYNAEGALRCLMGLNPARGFDWFHCTEDRYRMINELDQDYLDVLTGRVMRFRACARCGHRFVMETIFHGDCPECGFEFSRSPIPGQRRNVGPDILRYCHRKEIARYSLQIDEPTIVPMEEILTCW